MKTKHLIFYVVVEPLSQEEFLKKINDETFIKILKNQSQRIKE